MMHSTAQSVLKSFVWQASTEAVQRSCTARDLVEAIADDVDLRLLTPAKAENPGMASKTFARVNGTSRAMRQMQV